MLRPPFLALLALAFLPMVAGEGAAPYAPLGVAAEAVGSTAAAVEWTPGVEPADSYRVYGYVGSTPFLLLDTSHLPTPLVLAAIVPGGYEDYAVSGVRAGHESARIVALGGVVEPCIYVHFHPPGVTPEDCKTKADIALIRPLP